jgi:hypothetical protein
MVPDTERWPKVLEKVYGERHRLQSEHGETFIKRWQRVTHRDHEQPHGFGIV